MGAVHFPIHVTKMDDKRLQFIKDVCRFFTAYLCAQVTLYSTARNSNQNSYNGLRRIGRRSHWRRYETILLCTR